MQIQGYYRVIKSKITRESAELTLEYSENGKIYSQVSRQWGTARSFTGKGKSFRVKLKYIYITYYNIFFVTFTTEDAEIIKNSMEECIIQMSNLDNFLNDCKDLFHL